MTRKLRKGHQVLLYFLDFIRPIADFCQFLYFNREKQILGFYQVVGFKSVCFKQMVQNYQYKLVHSVPADKEDSTPVQTRLP